MEPQILEAGAKLTPFLLPDPTKIGVLVLPGGGYAGLSTVSEGTDICAWLNQRGYDAWMLEYATAHTNKTPLYPLPQNQAIAALKAIRALKRVEKLGIWGFSAGGHLAASTVTNPDTHADDAKLDFGILAYPVISMMPGITHMGSHDNLLGKHPDPELEKSMSNENRVSLDTPPIFLFHTADDGAVPVKNSLLFSMALTEHRVAFETHIYQHGPHGVGLATNDPILKTWPGRLEDWLAKR